MREFKPPSGRLGKAWPLFLGAGIGKVG